jgi:hypothetical protein
MTGFGVVWELGHTFKEVGDRAVHHHLCDVLLVMR